MSDGNVFVFFAERENKAYGTIGPMPTPPATHTTITMVAPPGWRPCGIARVTEGEVLELDTTTGVVSRGGVVIGGIGPTVLNGMREAAGLASLPRTKKPKTKKVAKSRSRTRLDPETGRRVHAEIPEKITARGPTLGWASGGGQSAGNGGKVEKVR